MTPASPKHRLAWWQWAAFPVLAAVVALTYLWVGPATYFSSPGAARIIFFHVPVAMLLAYWYLVAGVCSLRYLLSREQRWDVKAAAAAEVGLVCTILATISGAVFARVQWNSWWNWDPKQVAIVIILMIYAAYFALRGAVEDLDLRARVSAVYALLAGVAVPVIIKVLPQLPGTGTLHPSGTLQSGGMSADYRVVFWLALVGFLWVTSWLYRLRARLGALEG
ncbi:MAG: cytochrome c biogenesis protein CcsA [Armatimonadetes bacterium]|nr:cytochrome c biogenesis protein CcsA [Armatimonadota bacterium]